MSVIRKQYTKNTTKGDKTLSGYWPYSFDQRGKNGRQEVEAKVKAQIPTGNFDAGKIDEYMEGSLTKIQQIEQKVNDGKTLTKREKIIYNEHVRKITEEIKRDCQALEKSGINAQITSEEGRMRKLLMIAKLKLDCPNMIYRIWQKLSTMTFSSKLAEEFADLITQIENIVAKLDTIKAQFTTHSNNMPPLNEQGFQKLEPFQQEMIMCIRQGQSAIVQAPTSSGKSVGAGYIMACKKYKSVLVVVPTNILCWQMATMIGRIMGKDIPIITDTFKSSVYMDELLEKINRTQIVVGTPTELMNNLPLISGINFEYLVVDEIHMMGKTNCAEIESILKIYASIPVLALSATIGNVDELSTWFTKIGHKDVRVIKCEKRFFNLQNHYYCDGEMKRIHPLSMVSSDDIKTGNVLKKNLTPTPGDTWDLATKLKPLGLGDLDPYVYFTKDQRITLDQANIYWGKIINWLVDNYNTFSKDINSIVSSYKPHTTTSSKDKLTDVVFSLKEEDKLPAILFPPNKTLCLEWVKKFSQDIKDQESTKYPNMFKQRLKLEKQAKHQDKKRDQEDKMGEKKTKKAMLEGKLETYEPKTVSLLEPHPDYVVTKNICWTEYEIKHLVEELKQYFPNNGIEYHYIIDLLWRGVGVYVKGLPETYLRLVQNKACAGKLGLVFSDESLVFGVSMPFRTSIITPSDNLDSMMFQQMAGRAGRRGLDKEGHVLFVGHTWDEIKTLSASAIPSVQGADTMVYGHTFAKSLSNMDRRWDNMTRNYLANQITDEDATEFYQDIEENLKEGNAWDYLNTTDKYFQHLCWQFRHTDDCFRIPVICNYIKKIFRNTNPTNESTQIELAKFLTQFIEYKVVDKDSPNCMSIVESAKKYNIHTYLEELELEVPRYVDKNLFTYIQQNKLKLDNISEMNQERNRLISFCKKVIIIQHYFYYTKEVTITRLMSKLLTRCWWIYHNSSPIMQ